MLHVHGGQHVDAGIQDLLHRLPALLVACAGDVGVCKLVDEHVRGVRRENGVGVELGERRQALIDFVQQVQPAGPTTAAAD